MANHPIPLETVAVSVTEDALEAYEAALANACETVGFFRNHDTGIWRVEGVKQIGVNEAELASSLAVAAAGAATLFTPTDQTAWRPLQMCAVRGRQVLGLRRRDATVLHRSDLSGRSCLHGQSRHDLRALRR